MAQDKIKISPNVQVTQPPLTNVTTSTPNWVFFSKDPHKLREGLQLAWEGKFKDAEKFFTSTLTTNPENVQFLLGHAEVAAIQAVVLEDPNEATEAIKRLTELDAFLNRKLRGDHLNFWKKEKHAIPSKEKYLYSICLADVHMLMGGIYLRTGDYLRGSYSLKRSWTLRKALQDEQEADKDQTDDIYRSSSTQFCVGMYHFFLSLLPPGFSWLVESIGIQPDRLTGIKALQLCVEGGGHRSIAAACTLIWIEIFFHEDVDKAEQILLASLQQLPSCFFFCYLAGHMRRKQGGVAALDEAIHMFKKAEETTQSKNFKSFCNYEIGRCLFLKQEWEPATTHFVTFLSILEIHGIPFVLQSYCGWQIAVCQHMLGRINEALKVCKRVRKLARKGFAYDEYAVRKAMEYLAKGMPPVAELLLRLEIMHSARNFESVIKITDEVLESGQNSLTSVFKQRDTEEWARLMYWRARALRGLNRFKEAETAFNVVLQLETQVKREQYIVPHTLVELAEIFLEEDKFSEAKKLLFKAKNDYSSYDFENFLLRRITKLQEHVKAGKPGPKRVWRRDLGTEFVSKFPMDKSRNLSRGHKLYPKKSGKSSIPTTLHPQDNLETNDAPNTGNASSSESDAKDQPMLSVSPATEGMRKFMIDELRRKSQEAPRPPTPEEVKKRLSSEVSKKISLDDTRNGKNFERVSDEGKLKKTHSPQLSQSKSDEFYSFESDEFKSVNENVFEKENSYMDIEKIPIKAQTVPIMRNNNIANNSNNNNNSDMMTATTTVTITAAPQPTVKSKSHHSLLRYSMKSTKATNPTITSNSANSVNNNNPLKPKSKSPGLKPRKKSKTGVFGAGSNTSNLTPTIEGDYDVAGTEKKRSSPTLTPTPSPAGKRKPIVTPSRNMDLKQITKKVICGDIEKREILKVQMLTESEADDAGSTADSSLFEIDVKENTTGGNSGKSARPTPSSLKFNNAGGIHIDDIDFGDNNDGDDNDTTINTNNNINNTNAIPESSSSSVSDYDAQFETLETDIILPEDFRRESDENTKKEIISRKNVLPDDSTKNRRLSITLSALVSPRKGKRRKASQGVQFADDDDDDVVNDGSNNPDENTNTPSPIGTSPDVESFANRLRSLSQQIALKTRRKLHVVEKDDEADGNDADHDETLFPEDATPVGGNSPFYNTGHVGSGGGVSDDSSNLSDDVQDVGNAADVEAELSGENADTTTTTTTTMAEEFASFVPVERTPDPHFEEKAEHDRQMDDLVHQMRDRNYGVVIRNRTKFPRVFNRACIASEIVDWLSEKLSLPREEAVQVGQSLVDNLRLHLCASSTNSFRDDKKMLVRFQEDIAREENTLNMLKLWRLPTRNASIVVSDLSNMIYDIYTRFLDVSGEQLDLPALKSSDTFRTFALAVSELQKMDMHSLHYSEKISFFINIYNILVIHGATALGTPSNKFERDAFFQTASYDIGGLRYTLDDIEHGLLRCNSPPPIASIGNAPPPRAFGTIFPQFGLNDPRRVYCMSKKEPRIHFCLNYGTKSCPRLQVYTPNSIDSQLNLAGKIFAEKHVHVSNGMVILSPIFDWYKADFGKSFQLLKFVSKFVDDKSRRLLSHMVQSKKYNIKFEKYDWTSLYKM